MKLTLAFKTQFIANVLAATETADKHKIICAKWQQAFEAYIRATVKKDFNKKYGNHEWSAALFSSAASEIFPTVSEIYLQKENTPYTADSNWNLDSVKLTKSIVVPAYLFKGHATGMSVLMKLIAPFSEMKRTKELVAQAKVLAEDLWQRQKELTKGIESARNMEQFCKKFPELVKHIPTKGDDAAAINLVANLRKMGFDTTEKKAK